MKHSVLIVTPPVVPRPAVAGMALVLMLVGCGPSLPGRAATNASPAPVPSTTAPASPSAAPSSTGQFIPAPPTPPLPPQPDAPDRPAVTELLTVYVRLLDALNAFYRGVDDPLKLIATPEQVAHQLDLRKSWNGDRAQQELLVPHVRVIRLAPDDATIADTSVYRTVWYLHTGSQSPAVVKPVRLLEHFHRDQAGAWRFVEGLTVAADVDVPDTIIPDVAQKP